MFVVSCANGHVGHVVADELLQVNQKVRVIVHSNAKRGLWEQQGAEVVVGSVDDADFLASALQGASGFFAMIPPNTSAKDYFAWQCATSDATAQAVKKSGVPHVVLLSAVGADHEKGAGPANGQHYFEEVMRRTGAKITSVRAAYFQENIAGAIAAAENAGIYPNFMRSETFGIPMIATHDIGVFVARELLHPAAHSDVVDLTGPTYSARQLAQKIGEALGKTLPIVQIPAEQHVKTLTDSGVPPNFAELLAELYAGFEKGFIAPVGDRRLHGATPIDEVIRRMTAQMH